MRVAGEDEGKVDSQSWRYLGSSIVWLARIKAEHHRRPGASVSRVKIFLEAPKNAALVK
jgi:hypothetical protein